ncbi:MAG: glycosyltransferase family 4 protein, partial [Candidatus Saccharimonadales bacterium]
MAKALKIGFVLDDTLDSTDGVQQYVLTVGQWLERQGHEVHYLCGQSTRRDIRVHSLSRNVRVRFNGNRLSVPLPAKRQLISQLLDSQKFDVLHIQMPYSPWLAGRVIKLADNDKHQTALIATFHVAPSGNLARIGAKLLAAWTTSTSHELDTILAVSPVAADFVRRDFGLDYTVLANSFELKRFLSVKKSLAKSTKNNQLTLLFLGRLVPRKGCQYLL